MVLLIVAALGAILGYRLGAGRRGFVTMAMVSISTAALQLGHLFTTADRSSMTMLPLVVGTILVASMLAGALARHAPPGPSKAS